MRQTTIKPGLGYLRDNPSFGLLWGAQAISTLGDAVYAVALLWYALDATGSALAAGGIAISETAGRLLGSVLAGAVLDRAHTRTTMLASDLARLALTFGMAAAWLGGVAPPLWALYALAWALSLAGAFFNPARAAAVPQLVPRDHLLRANALDALSNSLVVTSAWAMSGVIVAALGPAASLLLDAGTFLASYLLVHAVRWERPALAERGIANPLAQVLGGARWAWGNELVRIVLGAEMLHALAAGFFVAALAAFVKELGGGAAWYGAQGGVFGVGLMLSSWLVGRARAGSVARLYAGGMVLNGLGNTAFGLAPSAPWMLPTVLFAGLGAPAWGAGRQSILQRSAPPGVRGRVFALLETLGSVTVLPAFAAGGWMADHLGARRVVLAASLTHVLIGLYLWASRRVRDADRLFTAEHAESAEIA